MRNILVHLIYIFIFFIVLISCDNKYTYKQTYSGFPIEKEISVSQIIDLDSLCSRSSLIKVKDSVCCICDMMALDGFFFKLYTYPDFKYIKSFGRKGQGPNELISVTGIDLYDSKLYALTPELHKVYIYDISHPSLDIDARRKTLNIPVTLSSLDLTIDKDGKLFISCLNQNYIAMKLDTLDNMNAETYFDIPLQEHKNDLTWLNRIGYNAKKHVLVSAITFREILFIRNLNDKHDQEIMAVGNFGNPKMSHLGEYEMPDNACFMQLFCSDKYIYTIFSGANVSDFLTKKDAFDMPQIKINVYNYDGEPIIQYIPETKDNSICICYVDEHSKKLFAFSNETDPASISVFDLE